MAKTQPTGDQLRFLSSTTGEHILDAYLEATEKGGRTLPDLLEDLFDPLTGAFNSDLFEFRLDTQVTGLMLQYRVGVYLDAETGWQDIDLVLTTAETGIVDDATAVLTRHLGSYADDAAADAAHPSAAEGVFYFKTSAPKGLRLRQDGAWTSAVLDASGALMASNNLSDLTDPAAARTSLSVEATSEATTARTNLLTEAKLFALWTGA